MPRGHEHDPLYSLNIRNMVFQCIFLGKKAIIITSKDGTTMFFSHYNPFFIFKEKLARKARVHMHTDASISDRAHAPWASHNTP